MSKLALTSITAVAAVSAMLLSACGEKKPEVNVNEQICAEEFKAWETVKNAGYFQDGINKYLAECAKYEDSKKK